MYLRFISFHFSRRSLEAATSACAASKGTSGRTSAASHTKKHDLTDRQTYTYMHIHIYTYTYIYICMYVRLARDLLGDLHTTNPFRVSTRSPPDGGDPLNLAEARLKAAATRIKPFNIRIHVFFWYIYLIYLSNRLVSYTTCGPTGGERKLEGRTAIGVTSPRELSSPLVLLISACIIIFHLIVSYLTSSHLILSHHISSCRTFCFVILFCYYLLSADIFYHISSYLILPHLLIACLS